MKFLIIGASGFVGSYLLTYIGERGYEVIGTQSASKKPGLTTFDLLKHRIAECIKPSFFDTGKPVFAVICAAFNQIDQCLLRKDVAYKINVENTIRLIKDLREHGAIPVFISTSAVYDGKVGYYNEDSPHAPISEYGRHKEAVEKFLQKQAPEAFIMRLDKVVSDEPNGNHVFQGWYELIQKGQQIVCIDQLCSPTFIKDVAEAALLGCKLGLSGAYNVANPEFFTRAELAKQFANEVGKEVEVIVKPQKEFNFADNRLTNAYLDSTKFIKKTGMRFTSMREAIESFLLRKKQSAD